MANIQIKRDRIIVGAATRLDLIQDATTLLPERIIELGPTVGDVIIRRETEYTDITNDLGIIIAKIATTDKFFVDMNLAESSIETLNEIWDKQDIEEGTTNTGEPTQAFNLIKRQETEPLYRLIVEGPGNVIETRGTPTPIPGTTPPQQRVPIYRHATTRQYNFPFIVVMASSQQLMQRRAITSIPITFQIIANTRPESNPDTPSLVTGLGERPEQSDENTILFGQIKNIGTNELTGHTINEDIPE